MIDHLLPLQQIERGKVPAYDLHMHTTWTDGKHSVAAMHAKARALGLKGVLFSEHARHSSVDWFAKFAREVRELPRGDCHALVGVEAKIDDFTGAIDSAPGILDHADLVMASVHRFPGEAGIVTGTLGYTAEQAIDLEYRLALAGLENPDVDILGHPFGMCYRRFKLHAPEDKMRALIRKAAKTGVAIEINAHYHPNPWQLVDWCKEAGARLSLGSNAHSLDEVGKINQVLKGLAEAWVPFES